MKTNTKYSHPLMKYNNQELKLHCGWQATIGVINVDSVLIVKKVYGTGKGWSHQDVLAIKSAIHRYKKWLISNGLKPVLTQLEEAYYDDQGWVLSAYQPYQYDDCEKLLLDFREHDQVLQAIKLFEQILKPALQVAYNPHPPMYRFEIKPRDVCIDSVGSLVMVDTFPPVLARIKGRIVCAHRRLTNSCILENEPVEVLSITGNCVGIIRNLCEHVMALFPEISEFIIRKMTQHVTRYDIGLANLIMNRLESLDTKEKVQVLRTRISARYLDTAFPSDL